MIIPWGTSEQALYGAEPNVQVYFKQGTDFALSDDQNLVSFDGTNITIDFGGPNEGYVKVR